MQGKYDQAEPLYVRALSILEHALGREHASTRSVCENYASLLQELGRDTEARQLEEDAWSLFAVKIISLLPLKAS